MNGTNRKENLQRKTPPAAVLAQGSNGHRLDSWKEIANYLGRSARCAQRWERNLGLPVHRLRHVEGFTVYAYVEELDAWRESRDHMTAQPAVEHASGDSLSSPKHVAAPALPRWSNSVFTLCRLILNAAPIRGSRS